MKNSIPELVLKMEETHHSKYRYPKIYDEYINLKSKITIICNECGDIFMQSVTHHIYSKSGCRNCYGNKPNTIESIFRKSKISHGENRYSYPTIYNSKVGSNDKIDIVCNRCGYEFKQTVHLHLNKRRGCRRCNKSKAEQLIGEYLTSNGVSFIPQFSFEQCSYKKPLLFDFYLPMYNRCIEYDGELHYIPRRDFKTDMDLIKLKDEIKTKFCLDNNIVLDRISYKENIGDRMKSIMDSIGVLEVSGMDEIRLPFVIPASKICKFCRFDKPLSDFNRLSKSIDGYRSYCRECEKIKYRNVC